MYRGDLHPDAYAIRPVRLIGEDELRHYEAVYFPNNPRSGIEQYLRQLLGDLTDDGSGLLLDILNEDGDIVQDYPLNRSGFKFLRSRLKLRVVK